MKASPSFKNIITLHLQQRAARDPLFAVTMAKKNKSIDECINYIFSEVKKSGCHGFSDDEVFAMAVHYYDEDDIKDIKPISGKVVVNRSVPASTSRLEANKTEVAAKPTAPAKKIKQVIVNQASLF